MAFAPCFCLLAPLAGVCFWHLCKCPSDSCGQLLGPPPNSSQQPTQQKGISFPHRNVAQHVACLVQDTSTLLAHAQPGICCNPQVLSSRAFLSCWGRGRVMLAGCSAQPEPRGSAPVMWRRSCSCCPASDSRLFFCHETEHIGWRVSRNVNVLSWQTQLCSPAVSNSVEFE